MSEYIKLSKEDFAPYCKGREHCTRPVLHIKYGGLFEFNRGAVDLLGKRVSFGEDCSSRNCFAVMRDVEGYELRGGGVSGRTRFNNSALAKHVIDKTWERDGHAADARKPQSMTFIIASLPVDDVENKDTFALIRKK